MCAVPLHLCCTSTFVMDSPSDHCPSRSPLTSPATFSGRAEPSCGPIVYRLSSPIAARWIRRLARVRYSRHTVNKVLHPGPYETIDRWSLYRVQEINTQRLGNTEGVGS